MPDEFMVRRGNGLFPTTNAGEATLSKVKEGEVVLVSFRRPRNPAFHRKFFALLRMAYDAVDWQSMNVARPPFEAFREWILIKVGHSRKAIMPDGSKVEIPKSISFASMGEEEFSELYDAVVDLVIEMIPALPTKEEINDFVERAARF